MGSLHFLLYCNTGVRSALSFIYIFLFCLYTQILLHGSESDKQQLRQHTERAVSACRSVIVPHAGQTLDITADLNVLAVYIVSCVLL